MSGEKSSEIGYQRADKELLEAKKELEEMSRRRKGVAPYCSFCDRGKGQYLFCIEGRKDVRICDSCVFNAYEKVVNELNKKE